MFRPIFKIWDNTTDTWADKRRHWLIETETGELFNDISFFDGSCPKDPSSFEAFQSIGKVDKNGNHAFIGSIVYLKREFLIEDFGVIVFNDNLCVECWGIRVYDTSPNTKEIIPYVFDLEDGFEVICHKKEEPSMGSVFEDFGKEFLKNMKQKEF